tara:strand:+ start:246 stop:1577 length:1332 start_codon:yes stop_codon:yes gene_type:complete
MGLLNQTPQGYYANSNNYGAYQYIHIDDVINNFMVSYVGEGKVINKVDRTDVAYHAQRSLQELNYDTLRSCKSIEVEVCGNLKVPLPQDYVNYVKLTWADSSGIEHIIYPNRKTSNPYAIEQTQGECDDCGDTSDTYNFTKSQRENYFSGSVLTPQEIECGTTDVTCAFSTTGLDNVTHLGANQVYQYLTFNSSANWWSANQKKNYWSMWFGLVDSYCACLKSSGAEENCGEQLDWSGFDLVKSQRTNVTVEMRDKSGWSNLRHNTFTNVNMANATNGTWWEPTTAVALTTPSSNTWDNYKSTVPAENNNYDYEDDTYWPNIGQRYGLDPEHAQVNGSYFIDCARGVVHFSSNLSGKTIILKYISDGLGKDEEMVVPKLAEEAIYKWIAYAILSTKKNMAEHIIQRYKKERFAETRKAKIRLSNLKIEELSQIMRGKSKHIKH